MRPQLELHYLDHQITRYGLLSFRKRWRNGVFRMTGLTGSFARLMQESFEGKMDISEASKPTDLQRDSTKTPACINSTGELRSNTTFFFFKYEQGRGFQPWKNPQNRILDLEKTWMTWWQDLFTSRLKVSWSFGIEIFSGLDLKGSMIWYEDSTTTARFSSGRFFHSKSDSRIFQESNLISYLRWII